MYLNGALMGFSTKEIDAMYDDIVDFAELGEFMEQKIKNYSSGMLVRLAFSMAIRAQSDILLLDEILAVGDEAFQRKCYAYFAKLRREKKTVILVTHSMDSVQRFCNRAILIHDGDLKIDGSPLEVARHIRNSTANAWIWLAWKSSSPARAPMPNASKSRKRPRASAERTWMSL